MIALFSFALVVCASSLHAEAQDGGSRTKVYANRGDNITLPCRLEGQSSLFGNRIKWAKLEDDSSETNVLISMGAHKKTYGNFQNRVYLLEVDDNDATLVITDLDLNDYGTYRCEIINGMNDKIVEVDLELQGKDSLSFTGVVFPYSPRLGRYNLNFQDAETACLEQDAVVASFEQLYGEWRNGMDWCNAGWLNDGTVKYPITKPREPCGGVRTSAGLRNYGRQDKSNSRYDVFCFTASLKGRFYYLIQPKKLNFDEAVNTCKRDGAEIAKVGHIYAAWKLQGYDRCDAGWLADGSVRYPISRPRKNCSPTEAAVRFVGFPDKKQKLYGVYCYKPQP
ncbi:hyaluronan and proteoglycan link protein 1-like isoform X1 [Sinocyclocheilus anshuiensis]|uniref:hyaluronan and proteoglycan link protein 1-like isoform X1 n=2 Tax=Sinocyclocheilus anshuiensis TaxID=1608454 RepID=UPI0007BA0981|nr:PREDICTED: hyaluronan and proteoglycan link protein 1-like isoform X1 [Sinocyclocheilus anshuiensis]